MVQCFQRFSVIQWFLYDTAIARSFPSGSPLGSRFALSAALRLITFPLQNPGAATVALSRSSMRWRRIRSAISRTISAMSSQRCEPWR